MPTLTLRQAELLRWMRECAAHNGLAAAEIVGVIGRPYDRCGHYRIARCFDDLKALADAGLVERHNCRPARWSARATSERHGMGERITRGDADNYTFREYRKVGTTKLSNEVLPAGTRVETLEGEYVCAEPSRLAIDVQGNVYPVAESVVVRSYELVEDS